VATQVTQETIIGHAGEAMPKHDPGRVPHLMDIFDNTTALDPATKERIRHRIWVRVERQRYNPRWGQEPETHFGLALLLSSLVTAVTLGVVWSGGHGALPRFGATGVAVFFWIAAIVGVSDAGLGRLIRSGPALYLVVAALAVLGIRSAPLAGAVLPVWTIAGLRAAMVSTIVEVSGLLALWLAEPIFKGLRDRRELMHRPEAAIVEGLLYLLANLKRLDDVHRKRDELILGTLARDKRRDDLIQQFTKNSPELRMSDWTDVKKQEDGTYLEQFNLDAHREDGSWDTVLHEERVMNVPDIFQEDPQWKTITKNFINLIEDIARYIEQGLPARLNFGDSRLDAWLKEELHGRAQTVRSWAQLVAFPSEVGYQDLMVQVGSALKHAAEDRWGAIPVHSYSEPDRWGRRILRIARQAAVGIIPLLLIVAAPKLGIAIPTALRDSLLTFAVPWILLQVLDFIVPNAGDYLSRSKSIRELLPFRRSDKE